MIDDTLKKWEALLENLKYLPDIKRLLEQSAGTFPRVIVPDPIPKALLAAPEYIDDFETLKSLLASSEWPKAVDADLICSDNDVSDKMLRAEGIIEFMIDGPVTGKKLLDFGCGEGHVVLKAAEKSPTLAYGFDIHPQDWESIKLPDPHKLTSSWDDVVAQAPYDIVLIYDVLDHLGDQSQALETLKMISDVITPGGQIFLRCHPWVSRHATHLYKKINKAYVHLVFSDVELARLGYTSGLPCSKIIHPHFTYKQWFNDAQLDLINENVIHESVENFFSDNPLLSRRIKNNWIDKSFDNDLNAGNSFPTVQLRIQFIDYILKKPV